MKVDSPAKKDIAIVAITRKGAALGRRLNLLLPHSRLYLPKKFAAKPKPDEHPFPSAAKEVVREAFSRYRYLVLIMAVGIAVRLVAPELSNKRKDPGVVVVDDSGSFSVSLLSGHVGGANQLAGKIASLIGAQPVITTASEVSQTIAVDLLGKEFGWELNDNRSVTTVSAALVNGEPVGIYQDAGEKNWWSKTKPLPDNVRIFTTIEAFIRANFQAGLIITDRILDNKHRALLQHHTMTYRPRSLVVGIGCNRGTPCSEIKEAVIRVFSEHDLSIKSIKNLATISLKRNETGLLKFARKYSLPIEYFDKEALCKVNFPSSPSAAALRNVGTPAVCESAALLSSGGDSLIVPKVSHKRAVTVAVARLGFNDKRDKGGKLFLVGIGPGSLEHITFKAKEAIDCSEVVIGYKTYIKLIEPYLRQKEVIATGMGAEIERVKKAISLARKGKIVSLVSSGDTGIYGMAGLVGEILSQQPLDDFDIEVIPGIPLLAAGAALLGAPISGDFVTISLSDYLVSWKEISRRLRLAAQGNFVIVIYNPKSKSRQHQLTKAREIILQHRPPSTPVGIVTNAYRRKQEVVITDLEHMFDYEIGMNTTIIIGNSATFTLAGWMVTPRGYRIKYDLAGESTQEYRT
ncbi:MAG: precorrin-3B C(17)-methyltransferase [Chloroflexi bacterium RBG_13_48_17]|nr:MAG: precorrin-3B C(17)-methyltransferase [Chloroflexi bacterium RBG_13_48_17]